MFPVNIRSHCSAVASVTLATGSFLSNKIFLYVSHRYGYHVMFWGFAAVNLGCAYYAYEHAVETTGKTFLEIQEILEEAFEDKGAAHKPRTQNDHVTSA